MYRKSLTDDTYMKSFLTDSTLREACTSCAFKGLEGVSDITLADFWGIENYIDKREYVTDKGVSAVIIRTGKGAQLFSECDEIDMEEMDIDKVIDSNPSLIKSVKNNPIRYKILNELQTNDYDEVITKYYGNGVIPKIRRAVLKILM